jgi:hypothetical protein
MIRLTPKEKSKGLKKSPLKRKPFKRIPPKVYARKPLVMREKKPSRLKIRIDPLDSLVSEYVRKRAVKRVGGCEKCLKPHNWKDLQCSHFFGRKDKATRYDADNLVGICFYCHNHFHAFPLEHVQWFEQHLGKENFELLQGRNRILEKPDKKILTLYYQQQIKLLDIV